MPQFSLLGMLCILILAYGLRFHALGAQSLWHDEGNSVVQASRSFIDIAENASRDIHPPGYYWLLAIWRNLAGQTEFGLRSLSTFASVLTVAFAYALGKRLYGYSAGLAAAVFTAINTFSIFYAQEARMYALLALWSAASMWVFVDLLKDIHRAKSWQVILPLAILNAAGLYTQYAFPFVMMAQGVAFLVWIAFFRADLMTLRKGLTWYIMANVITLILFAPWMFTAWEQVTTWPSTGQDVTFASGLATILAYLAFGITLGGGLTVTVAFFLVFGLIQPATLKQQLTGQPVKSAEVLGPYRRWAATLPAIWVAVIVGLFFTLDLYRDANLKFLLPAQVGFALWVGHGVEVLWHTKVNRESVVLQILPRFTALLGVVAIVTTQWSGLNALYNDADYQRDDYRAIVVEITRDADPEDAIVLSAPNQNEVFSYYYHGDIPVYELPHGLGGDDEATRSELEQIISEHRRIYAVLWATQERDPNQVVETTLDSDAYEADSRWFGDVRLVRYVTPVDFETFTQVNVQFGEHITLEQYALSSEIVEPGDVLQIQLHWSTDFTLEKRYKVFIQLINPEGVLVAQRDSEPGGGQLPTTSWQPGETIVDNHALIVPNDLPMTHYSLILGFYNPNDPLVRLPVNQTDFLTLSQIAISSPKGE